MHADVYKLLFVEYFFQHHKLFNVQLSLFNIRRSRNTVFVSPDDGILFCYKCNKVLGKSVKPIPVMILGVVMARKRYPYVKYLYVMMIVLGVAFFMYKPKKDILTNSLEDDHVFGFGEFLLVCI